MFINSYPLARITPVRSKAERNVKRRLNTARISAQTHTINPDLDEQLPYATAEAGYRETGKNRAGKRAEKESEYSPSPNGGIVLIDTQA